MCHTNNLKRKNITLAKKFLGRDPPEVRYVHFHRKMQTILMVIVKLMNLMSRMSSLWTGSSLHRRIQSNVSDSCGSRCGD